MLSLNSCTCMQCSACAHSNVDVASLLFYVCRRTALFQRLGTFEFEANWMTDCPTEVVFHKQFEDDKRLCCFLRFLESRKLKLHSIDYQLAVELFAEFRKINNKRRSANSIAKQDAKFKLKLANKPPIDEIATEVFVLDEVSDDICVSGDTDTTNVASGHLCQDVLNNNDGEAVFSHPNVDEKYLTKHYSDSKNNIVTVMGPSPMSVSYVEIVEPLESSAGILDELFRHKVPIVICSTPGSGKSYLRRSLPFYAFEIDDVIPVAYPRLIITDRPHDYKYGLFNILVLPSISTYQARTLSRKIAYTHQDYVNYSKNYNYIIFSNSMLSDALKENNIPYQSSALMFEWYKSKFKRR